MTKLVSERISVKDFFRGLIYQRVDYSTREYSRCYRWGLNTGAIIFVLIPIVIIFGLGFAAGRYL